MGGTVGVGGAGRAASVLGYTWLAVSVSSSLRSDGGNDVGSWPRSRGRHAVPLGVGFRVGANSEDMSELREEDEQHYKMEHTLPYLPEL